MEEISQVKSQWEASTVRRQTMVRTPRSPGFQSWFGPSTPRRFPEIIASSHMLYVSHLNFEIRGGGMASGVWIDTNASRQPDDGCVATCDDSSINR